jgi:hypothetical protein
VFTLTRKTETHPLDETIESLISEIAGMSAGDELYTAAVASLKTLMEIRTADKAAGRIMSPDAMTTAAAHLLGIVMILGFEKANVITSKGLSFVPKIR